MKRAAIVSRRRQPPLEVVLTFKMNFSHRPEDALTLIKNRRLPLVGSVFQNRDRIARGMVRLLITASARQPQVWRGVLSLRRRLMGEGPATDAAEPQG